MSPRRAGTAASGIRPREDEHRETVRNWKRAYRKMDGRDTQSPEIPDLTETSDVRLANAQLETTIREMRVRLEQERSAAESAGQAALADMAGEVSALKRTIQEMRDQMEAQHNAGEAEIQSVRSAAAAEIAALESTIGALRAELEAKEQLRQKELSDREVAFARERESLQQHIKSIRAELETRS
jgi:predicted  nucleic acid-binding Zn-ribbon protein